MTFRLKTEFNGDIRLFKHAQSDVSTILQALNKFISKTYKIGRTYYLKYLDEDNDEVTISSRDDMNDALTQSKERNKILKIKIYDIKAVSGSETVDASDLDSEDREHWFLPHKHEEVKFDAKEAEVQWLVKPSEKADGTINKIRDIVDKLDMSNLPKNKEFISISIGDPTKYPNLRPPHTITSAVQTALLSHQWNGYGPSVGFEETRVALARTYSYPHTTIDETDVYLTCGCSDAINISMSALMNEGDNILLPQPGFSLYETLCSRYGFKPKFYRCLADKGWAVDVKHLESLIDGRTRAILINNPSNPCGSVLTKQNLLKILAVAERNRVPIIADEIYHNMVFEKDIYFPIASLSKHVPILTLGGLAKQYLVPGWRVGWIVVHDPKGAFKVIKETLRKLTTVVLGPNTLMQAAIPAILYETPQSYYKELNDTLHRQCTLMEQVFSIIPELSPVSAKGAMYLMVKIDVDSLEGVKDDMDFANGLLREEAVLVLPGAIFGAPNFFRAVVCPPPHVIKEVGSRVGAFCARHRIKKTKSIVQSKL